MPEETQAQENPSVARARKFVLALGWNSTSFQIGNPGIDRWFTPEGDAVVGYVTANKIRIVVGAPICTSRLLPDRWEPVFAVSNEPRVSFRTLYAKTSAFSGNSSLRRLSGGLSRAATTEIHWLNRLFLR